jgi:predicted TIM-barrel fold metal-dependent hydrolase
LYFDAVAYGSEELGFVSDVIARAGAYAGKEGVRKELNETWTRSEGSRRMLFGTDHPFFPPLQDSDKWRSVVENLEAIDGVRGWSEADKDGVRGGNAVELFSL